MLLQAFRGDDFHEAITFRDEAQLQREQNRVAVGKGVTEKRPAAEPDSAIPLKPIYSTTICFAFAYDGSS